MGVQRGVAGLNLALFLQANETRNAGIRLPGRFAQVKEETAQRAGDTEQNVQAV